MDSSQKTQPVSANVAGLAKLGAVYSGYNLSGVETTCSKPPEELACTMVYTEGEQFSAKCSTEGGQSFTCGCHQYLCSTKITFP